MRVTDDDVRSRATESARTRLRFGALPVSHYPDALFSFILAFVLTEMICKMWFSIIKNLLSFKKKKIR